MYKVYSLAADEIFLKSINDYNDEKKKKQQEIECNQRWLLFKKSILYGFLHQDWWSTLGHSTYESVVCLEKGVEYLHIIKCTL